MDLKNSRNWKGDFDLSVFINEYENGLNYNHYTTSVKFANFNAVIVYDLKIK